MALMELKKALTASGTVKPGSGSASGHSCRVGG